MDNRKHITVVIGRYTLLALARGEEVHLSEVDASAVVTLIPESFFPSKAILAALEPEAVITMSQEPTDDLLSRDGLLTCSPAVCRAMAKFHRALARKGDPRQAAENLRAADLWQGAARTEGQAEE